MDLQFGSRIKINGNDKERGNKMIDIHTHLLYEVDDGAKSMEESIAMLQDAKNQGIEKCILTPHYRHGMFPYHKDKIDEHFTLLQKEAEKIGIEIYIGCEFHVDSSVFEYLQTERCYTLAQSSYVLTEYSYVTEYDYIYEKTKRLIACGYTPVIAHAERYECFLKKPKLCEEISDLGAYIQINADSVLGLVDKKAEKFCKKVLSKGWADVVASDSHGIKNRNNNMAKAYDLIEKKYGEEYAQYLFYETPLAIIKDR